MRVLARITKVAATGLFALLCTTESKAQSSCLGPDQKSADVIGDLMAWMNVTDPDEIAERDTIYKIPVVPVNQITLVTDTRVCAKVRDGLVQDRDPGVPQPPAVYVVKMGPKYFAVHDSSESAGPMKGVVILDSKYRVVGGWAGP